MLNRNLFIFLLSLILLPQEVMANSVTLGSITAQRGILEDLNLQVQIQEQSKKLNQLLMPVPVSQEQGGELTAKQLLDKLEVPKTNEKERSSSTASDGDTRESKIIAIYSSNNQLKAKIKYKGKSFNLSNGQMFQGQKVQIYRDRVLIGSNELEL